MSMFAWAMISVPFSLRADASLLATPASVATSPMKYSTSEHTMRSKVPGRSSLIISRRTKVTLVALRHRSAARPTAISEMSAATSWPTRSARSMVKSPSAHGISSARLTWSGHQREGLRVLHALKSVVIIPWVALLPEQRFEIGSVVNRGDCPGVPGRFIRVATRASASEQVRGVSKPTWCPVPIRGRSQRQALRGGPLQNGWRRRRRGMTRGDSR